MGDEETTEVEEKKEKKSLLSNPVVLIGIIVVFQAVIALMMVKFLSPKKDSEEVEPAVAKEVLAEPEVERGTIVMLENIVVNLKERDKLYYLKVTIGLEVPDGEIQSEVMERQAQLRDDVIALLSGKNVSNIDALEERNALKAELTRRINSSLLSGDIIEMYFSDFVIQ